MAFNFMGVEALTLLCSEKTIAPFYIVTIYSSEGKREAGG
jgi:hypothetical protein